MVELQGMEKDLAVAHTALMEAEGELHRLRLVADAATKRAAEVERFCNERSEHEGREHAVMKSTLKEQIEVAEATMQSEVESCALKLQQATEQHEAELSNESFRRESAEEEVLRLRREVEEADEERNTMADRLRDAQKLALETAMGAKRVGVAAQEERERSRMLQMEHEAARKEWNALEIQIREEHAEALSAAQREHRYRLETESDAKKMEECGVLAHIQAEEEQNAREEAMLRLLETERMYKGAMSMVCMLSNELRDSDIERHQNERGASQEISELKAEIVKLRMEREIREEAAAALLVEAKAEVKAVEEEKAAEEKAVMEQSVRSEMQADKEAAVAMCASQARVARKQYEEEMEAHLLSVVKHFEVELEAVEIVLSRLGVEGFVAARGLKELEDALSGADEQARLQAQAAGDERSQKEGLIKRLTRERDEALQGIKDAEKRGEDRALMLQREASDDAARVITEHRNTANSLLDETENALTDMTKAAEAARGEAALCQHLIQKLEADKQGLLEKLESASTDWLDEKTALQQQIASERERAGQNEEESEKEIAELQSENERLGAELDSERERRTLLAAAHEREMSALKSALQKATGIGGDKPASPTTVAPEPEVVAKPKPKAAAPKAAKAR